MKIFIFTVICFVAVAVLAIAMMICLFIVVKATSKKKAESLVSDVEKIRAERAAIRANEEALKRRPLTDRETALVLKANFTRWFQDLKLGKRYQKAARDRAVEHYKLAMSTFNYIDRHPRRPQNNIVQRYLAVIEQAKIRIEATIQHYPKKRRKPHGTLDTSEYLKPKMNTVTRKKETHYQVKSSKVYKKDCRKNKRAFEQRASLFNEYWDKEPSILKNEFIVKKKTVNKSNYTIAELEAMA